VRGLSAGTSLVKLDQLGTSELLDEVDLQAEPIASVTLFPSDTILLLEEAEAQAADTGSASQPVPFAMLAGSAAPIPLVVRLHGAGTDRLVDEGTTVTSPQGPLSRQAWDRFGAQAPAAGPVTFSIQAGAGSFTAVVKVVDAIDSISQFTIGTPAPTIQVDTTSGTDVCFTARSGGVLVAGATWAFSASSNVVLSPGSPSPSCVNVKGQAAGTATVTATAGGISRTFDVEVVAAPHQRAPSIPRHDALRGVVQPTAGHRAEWAAAR
jgi:hypothetical protein